jgi:hypothetical protein
LSVDPNFKVLAVAYPYVANRLLNDTAPELRMALKDLLFRDGEFRWNRLENLLSNAQENPDYNLNGTLDKGIDFLLSDRSEFMHDRIIDEIVKGIEVETSKRLPERFRTSIIGDIVIDPKVKATISTTEAPSSLGYIARLWTILQKDKAIAPSDILPLATRILSKRQTLTIGRDVISKLAQRSLVRVVREVLLRDEKKYQDDKQQDLVNNSIRDPQSEERELVGSGLRRPVNGRSW